MSHAPAAGELVVSRFDEHVEVCVKAPQWDKPRVYAYRLTDPIMAFCDELGRDLIEGAGGKAPVVQVTAATGAVVSLTTSHSFAWKPGRSVHFGSTTLAVCLQGNGTTQTHPLQPPP